MEALGRLGAASRSLSDTGTAPVEVTGRLAGGRTEIAASTSQFLSSLLLCCPLADADSDLQVTLLNEPGYVRMTLDWLDAQGIDYERRDMARFKVRGGQSYRAFERRIPGDFSSATFLLCAGCLAGRDLEIEGLDFTDSQPDKAVVDYLLEMGAGITVEPDSVRIKASSLKGADLDMNTTPDALPAMAVTAAFAEGTTKLFNVPQARHKETDRITCMAGELRKMGVDVEELPDGLIIHQSRPRAAMLDGRGDHRVVMALSLAGLVVDEELSVSGAEAVGITFPGYVELMRSVGADMENKLENKL
jgi:3-phosphoshikimate 1-carboxyvinyltransferase